MAGWGRLSRPGVPFPSEAICIRNHQPPALSSGTAALPAPGPPPPPQALSRVPTAGTPTGAQCLGLSGKGTRPQLLPRPWGSEEKRVGWGSGRIPGAQERTRRQEVPCVHCPATRATAASTPGSSLGSWACPLPPWDLRAALRLPPPPQGDAALAAPAPAQSAGEQAPGAPGLRVGAPTS
ncbi:translation initiation factor IF-2-like [Lemur catta]|uniref:translation initiation factor IF-2-like n=1 Tax=Lemur catta TaxID=9447 RepID=UPI001E267D00|nr:translation initiation factor IF-2-like [Lemur catta]